MTSNQRTHFCLVSIFWFLLSPYLTLDNNFLLPSTFNVYQGLVHSSKALPTSFDANEIHDVYFQSLWIWSHHCHFGFKSQEPGLQLDTPLSLRLHFPISARPCLRRPPGSSVCCTEFHSLTSSCLHLFSPRSLSLQIIGLKSLPNKSLHVQSPLPAVWSDGGFQNANIIPP